MQIITDGGAILNDTNIVEESMTLQESICSESQLRFGSCEASVFKIRLIEQFLPVSEQKITVSMPYNGKVMQLGRYKVTSDKPTADRRYRDIVAYDAMYDIINSDVAEWYNTVLPAKGSTVTLKAFRDSFLAHFGIEQECAVLVNDSMIVEKTIEPSELSGKTVVTAICEINGCFGHIGRDGKFHYVHLEPMKDGLFPLNTLYPADDLYPTNPGGAELEKRVYYSCNYEDYKVKAIDKLRIRQEENDVGVTVGTGNNCYIIEDNFLVYGKGVAELTAIANNILSKIKDIVYIPCEVGAKGNPELGVGDAIYLYTKNKFISTYILQRTIRGIYALLDTYEASGEEYCSTAVNSTERAIIQLKGKTNALIRTVEETRMTITDLESNMQSQFQQTAESINLKVSKGSIISEINQTAETITISASKIDLNGLVNADEFVSKYATLTSLNSVSARIDNLLNDRMQVSGYFGLVGDFAFMNVSVKWGTIDGVKVLMANE